MSARRKPARPSVRIAKPADQYAMDGETIVEVFSRSLQKGCLVSVYQAAGGELVIVPYRADSGVVVRLHGKTYRVPL